MAYIFQISLLWFLFGVISWLLGGWLTRRSRPGQELLLDLKKKEIKMFTYPPKWAKVLCGFNPNTTKIFGIPSTQLQLGGLVLIILSGLAGFLTSPTFLGVGMVISAFLYIRIPQMFIHKWTQL